MFLDWIFQEKLDLNFVFVFIKIIYASHFKKIKYLSLLPHNISSSLIFWLKKTNYFNCLPSYIEMWHDYSAFLFIFLTWSICYCLFIKEQKDLSLSHAHIHRHTQDIHPSTHSWTLPTLSFWIDKCGYFYFLAQLFLFPVSCLFHSLSFSLIFA